ncbi:hypothetical protein D3C85_1896170 [compost metagenome]
MGKRAQRDLRFFLGIFIERFPGGKNAELVALRQHSTAMHAYDQSLLLQLA